MRYNKITYRNIFICYDEKNNDISTAQFMVNTNKGIRIRKLVTYELIDFLEGQYPTEELLDIFIIEYNMKIKRKTK